MRFQDKINDMILSHADIIESLYLLFINEGLNDDVIMMSSDLKLVKIKNNSFRLPEKYDVLMNRRLLEIASIHKYKINWIESIPEGDYFVEFEKVTQC